MFSRATQVILSRSSRPLANRRFASVKESLTDVAPSAGVGSKSPSTPIEGTKPAGAERGNPHYRFFIIGGIGAALLAFAGVGTERFAKKEEMKDAKTAPQPNTENGSVSLGK